jgi:hypothetical protein
MLRLAATLIAALVAVGAGAGSATAKGLDLSPFGGGHAGGRAAVSLNPFRIARA